MSPADKNAIHRCDSVISVETLPGYPDPVVVKRPSSQPPSRQVKLSLEREYAMTRALDGVEGVRKALGQKAIEGQPALILEYVDGETLREAIEDETLDLSAKLGIAVELARILGSIHDRDIIHLALDSGNILISPDLQSVHIIDLGSAVPVDRSGRQKVGHDQLLGALPYISPEQTGRINRPVDERSDLYSLGVILHELMSRHLPFDAKDPAKLVHDHIARLPVSPSEVSPGIPEVLGAIILKLLSKSADDRYQSAAGVQADLEKCIQRLSPEGTIEDFPLGETDYAIRLRFPQKLYGRDRELQELESAFESVCRDTASIVFVGGYSGIGKTALVEEIQRPVSERGGYFIEGKFDQLATTPYAGITHALAHFVSQILTLSETQLATWRSMILEAVGSNGSVLVDVVPSLEMVIGPQPAVPDLSGQEAQNRFNYVFQRFLGAIAQNEHPLCIFLDDLQWVDPASLSLLKALFTSPDLAHFLVIGAYRDNEADGDHPLMAFIADLAKAGVNPRRMTLQILEEANIEAFISDTLQSHQDETRELSKLIYSQADGNPFFTRQVLHDMEDRGLFVLNTVSGRWGWDMDVLRDQDVTASVVELLVGKLKGLPVDIQETLKVAACIGNQFDIPTLTVVTAGDTDAIRDHIREAVAAGLIWEREDRGYFVHDRVQEAAYALVPMEERDQFHLTIGRLLLERQCVGDDGQDLYQVVDQLNHGLHLIEDKQERVQIARLNLQVARAAGQATAFETGLTCAKAGIELLGENSWENQYRLTLGLHERGALLAQAAGRIADMQHHSQQVLHHGRNPIDLARVQRMLMEFLSGNNRAKEAFELGIEALRILGVEFPADPQAEPLAEMLIDLNARLQRESLAIFSMPHLQDQDPELGAITQILPDLLVAAYICNPRLGPLVVVRYLELCLERRLLPASFPPMLASLALYICGGSELWSLGVVNETKDAAKHAQVAARLADGEHFVAFRCSVICMNDYYISFWDGHLRETLHNLERAIQVGHDTGCNDWAGYSSNGWVRHALYASVDPDSVRNRAGELLVFIDSLHYDTQSRWTRAPAAAAQALSGHSLSRGASWRSDLFDDERDLPEMQRSGDGIGLFITYSAKAWTAVLFGDNDGVEKYTELACSYLQAGPGMLERAIVSFVCGLRRARELRENPLGPGGEQTLEEHIGQLRRWADKAPMNFAHKLWLVQAEVHRSRGEVVQAMQAYEKASQGARENDYLNEAGLAHALAAEFFQDLGLSQAALHNAEQAAQAWRSWGAEALVEKLRERWPELSLPAVSTREATGSSGVSQTAMDLSTVVKASQALAGEIVLARLLAKMLQIVIENAGATRGYLLLKKKERWIIEAVGDVDETDVEVLQSIDVEDQEQVSTRIVNYVARSAKVVSLDDAVGEGGFADDPTVLATKAKSILCLPLVNQGRTSAILYLENNLTTGAFTSEGVELLQLLSSQMAMALDNARLYSDLEGSETRFRSLVEHANEAIVVAQDEAVKYCNPQFSALTGYALEEIVSGQFTEFVHPVDRDRVMREYRARMSGERPASEYSIRIITKDGREKHIRVSSALIDWDGRPATLAMLGDVTEQKEAEEQISAYQERLRALAAELTLTEERERRRIATELHDGPAQSLTVARLQLASAVKSVGDEKASAKLSEMSLNLKESLRQIREVLLDLSSNTLNEIGLSAALSEWLEEQVCKRHGLQAAFVDEAGVIPLDDNARALLYRHVRELIMNAIKHAEASKVSVHMVASEQTLRITVEDDGRGFDQDGTTRIPSGKGGFGLFSIRERMADMDGSIEIESKPGEGCKATLTVPLGSG